MSGLAWVGSFLANVSWSGVASMALDVAGLALVGYTIASTPASCKRPRKFWHKTPPVPGAFPPPPKVLDFGCTREDTLVPFEERDFGWVARFLKDKPPAYHITDLDSDLIAEDAYVADPAVDEAGDCIMTGTDY